MSIPLPVILAASLCLFATGCTGNPPDHCVVTEKGGGVYDDGKHAEYFVTIKAHGRLEAGWRMWTLRITKAEWDKTNPGEDWMTGEHK